MSSTPDGALIIQNPSGDEMVSGWDGSTPISIPLRKTVTPSGAALITQVARKPTLVANRTAIQMYGNIAANSGGNSYSGHYISAATAATNLQLIYGNLLSAHPEAVGAGSIAIISAVEYPTADNGTVPTGKVYQNYGRGTKSTSIDPGAILTTAPLSIFPLAGDYIRVRSNVVAAAWSEGLMPSTAANFEGVQRSTTTDRTITPTGMTFSNTQQTFTPTAIIGVQAVAAPTVVILGDSTDTGLLETLAPYVGPCARALGQTYAWANFAQPSISAFEFGGVPGITGSDRYRLDLIAACNPTHCLERLGQNDVANSTANGGSPLTLAQIQQAIIYIWFQLRSFGVTVITQTITPKCDSSDGFTTQAGLSPAPRQGPGGTRVGLNQWKRAGAPMINGVAVAAGTPGALVIGQPGHPVAHFLEVANTVECDSNGVFTPDTGIWFLPYLATSDGLGVHPNTVGSIAMSTAIDLSTITLPN